MSKYIKNNKKLYSQWNFEKNKDLDPSTLLSGSNKKVWWKCEKGHEWEAIVSSRYNGAGCPYCSNRLVLTGYNDLKTINYELSEDWDYKKNINIKPDTISPNSHEHVWWKCSKCGFEWKAEIKSRNSGTGCPECAKQKLSESHINNSIKKSGSLLETNPNLAKEWNYDKNKTITPNSVTAGSNKKVWWKCEKGHEWEAVISSRNTGVGCPYCSNRLVLPGYNDLETINPKLIDEWDYDKNKELDPKILSPNSHKNVWWKCSKCGFEWKAEIKSRNSGTGCPECGKQRMIEVRINNILKDNCSFGEAYPELLIEWDYSKNQIDPYSITKKSSKKVWWKCSKCDFEWESPISSRANGYGCKKCGFKQSAKTRVKDQILNGGSLMKNNPRLAKEWNYAKNKNITPNDVTVGSDLKVWWKCEKGHEWEAVISSRNMGIGCPICNGEKSSSFPEQAILYYLSKIYNCKNRDKSLGKEIDIYIPKVNVGIEYDGNYYHKSKSSKIRDSKKDEYFNKLGVRIIRVKESSENSIEKNIIKYIYTSDYSNLKYAIECLIKILNCNNIDINIDRDKYEIYSNYLLMEKENSIAAKKPQLEKEWNYEKNKQLKPEFIPYSSNKKVWWKCEKGHEWEAVVSSRYNGAGCPYCSGRKALEGFNDLITLNPSFIEEWDYDKNININPSKLTTMSNKKVWWMCTKCGYEWETSIAHRSRGRGCPECGKKKMINKRLERQIDRDGSLKENNLELSKEWNYGKNNKLKPENVTPNSNKKVWWKCPKCNYEWEAVISSRNHGAGCPKCTNHLKRIVLQYDKDNKLIKKYDSVSTASKSTGIHTTSISNACKGNAKTAGGYIWKYAKDNTID